MNGTDDVLLKDVRRRLFDVIDAVSMLDSPVVKAIPLAFPVIEADFTLCELVPEPIGLVRRAVLRAVCEFGPCNAESLHELLGLGADVIERTLLDLATAIPDLTRTGRNFIAGPECLRLVRDDVFTRRVTHQHKFAVNGLTDELLPNSFWNTHQAWRLYPDSGNPDGAMRTASGQTTPIVARIVDRGATGRDHLQRLVEEGTAELRETLGVPAGVCEPIADPSAVRIAWVAGFLVLRADESVQVLSARRQPVTLLERKAFTKDYLRRVCQGLKPRFLDQDRSDRTYEKWLRRWPQGTECYAGRECGELVIRVPEPEKTLQGVSGESAEAQSIRMMLERGRDWDPFTYAIYRFVPGDVPTAHAVALLRGIRDLRYLLQPLDRTGKESAPINLPEWWQEWQASFSRQLPFDMTQSPVTVDQLLAAADRVNDTEFHDKLERLQG